MKSTHETRNGRQTRLFDEDSEDGQGDRPKTLPQGTDPDAPRHGTARALWVIDVDAYEDVEAAVQAAGRLMNRFTCASCGAGGLDQKPDACSQCGGEAFEMLAPEYGVGR